MEEHVIENFYTDYFCKQPAKSQKLRKLKNKLGAKVGDGLKKLGQLISNPGKSYSVLILGALAIFCSLQLIIFPQITLMEFFQLHSATINLTSTICYLAGIVLGWKAALKFKEHGDPRPDMVRPLVETILSSVLIALPSILYL